MLYVLIIDWQPLMRKGIKEVLYSSFEEINIYEANNYQAAIALMKQYEFTVLITDIHIQGENGFHFINEIKMSYPRLKILVLASNYNPLEFQRANELSVNGFLLKDALAEEFLYAFRVVSRGDNYYATSIVDKYYEKDLYKLDKLTIREKQIFEKLEEGLSDTQISNQLFISESTTKKYISNIMSKLNITSRLDIIFYTKQALQN